MNEAIAFDDFLLYFLIAAYYLILLRLWLPPPSGKDHEAGGDKATVASNGGPSRTVFRPIALAEDKSSPAPPSKAIPPADPLERIRSLDKRFDEGTFLSGASRSYELVLKAYAEGDALTLRKLLGPEAAAAFCSAIHERREKGESMTLDLVRIRDLDIVDVSLAADQAEITVRFTSELIAATRVGDAVIDGDPERIVKATDLWTFARHLRSRDPNWKIIATC